MNKNMKFEKSRLLPVLIAVLLIVSAAAQTSFAQPAQSDPAGNLVKEASALMKEENLELRRSAIGKLEQARKIYLAEKRFVEEAETVYLLGIANLRLGEMQTALKIFEEVPLIGAKALDSISDEDAQKLQKITRIMYLAASNEFQLGTTNAYLKNKDKAIEHLTNALQYFREIGVAEEEANALQSLAKVYEEFGENIKAIDYYKESLALAKQNKDVAAEAFLQNYIGRMYYSLQENRKALEYFSAALPLQRSVKNRFGEGQTLANLGTVYMALSENQKALEFLLLALPVRREVKDQYGEAITLNNIGMVYLNLGENRKALDYFTQSIPIYKQIGEVAGEATALSNIALIYEQEGDAAKALEYLTRVLKIRRETSDQVGETIALNNLGAMAMKAGEFEKALEYFNSSAAISNKIGNRETEAAATVNIGVVYFEMGRAAGDIENLRSSINELQSALILYNSIGSKRGEAETLGQLMNCYALINKLRNSAESSDLNLAVTFGKMSVNKFQTLRGNIQGLDRKTQKSYLAKIEENYRTLADLMFKAKRLPEAHQVLNSFKDQQFFDLDAASVKSIEPIAVSSGEQSFIDAYENLAASIGRISQETIELKARSGIGGQTPEEKKRLENLGTEFLKASVNFNVLLANGENYYNEPENNDYARMKIPDTAAMQNFLKEISLKTNAKTVAVYQLAGRADFHLLLITPDAVKTISVPVEKAFLQKRALDLWALLQSDVYDPKKVSKELYDLIFKPLEKELPKDTKNILWSLDGNLRYVPVAALFDGKQYLVERYNHVNFTRADAGRMLRPVAKIWRGAAFGTSRQYSVALGEEKINFSALPGVDAEMREIFKAGGAASGVIEGEVLANEKFTQTSMISALKSKRPLVHIASHFSFRPGDEARSFLLMGDGTAFTLEEMKKQTNLFSGVELLTLSACNTAAQQADSNGREVDGFAELAQRLGADAVMATLWQVSDASTPWLMREFYDLKLNKSRSKAEALRLAQISLINGTAEAKPSAAHSNNSPVKIEIVKSAKNKKTQPTRSDLVILDDADAPLHVADKSKPFAHPYYWSPFILFGNWK